MLLLVRLPSKDKLADFDLTVKPDENQPLNWHVFHGMFFIAYKLLISGFPVTKHDCAIVNVMKDGLW